jgi:segregation and condensation protein A
MTLPDSAASLPLVQTGQFLGPLDMLLDEVRRQNVAIEKIAMVPIVARFLDYVRTATKRNLNLDIEWLHMAATLIHWKSQSLLPAEVAGGPSADPIRDDLVRQLLTHRKQAAEELARHRSLEETRFSRIDREFREEAGADEPDPPFVSVWDMTQQARDLGRWVRQHREGQRDWRETFGVEPDDVTVADMMVYLRCRLASEDGKLDGAKLLQDPLTTASHRACLFLGMLEMIREQQLQAEQPETFGPIWLSTTP